MLMTGPAMTAVSIEVLRDAVSWVDWVVVRVEVRGRQPWSSSQIYNKEKTAFLIFPNIPYI